LPTIGAYRGAENLSGRMQCGSSALNGEAETFGKIKLESSVYEVRWCLLEEEQMVIVMDVPDLSGRI
jgi:hypothetical protein